MTAYYLDSSVVLHALLRTSPAAAAWIEQTSGDPDTVFVSSRLLRTEVTRVLRREGLPVEFRDAIMDRLDIVPVTDAILAAAEAIVPHVRTLDAIHLASVIAYGADLVLVTHDEGMAAVAREIGYHTVDPVRFD